MCTTKTCIEMCINKAFLLDEKLLKDAQEIVANLTIKATTGRPPINFSSYKWNLLSSKNRNSMASIATMLWFCFQLIDVFKSLSYHANILRSQFQY